MKKYTLSQQYAILGLNSMDSLHMTAAKRAVLRAIAAAQLLEVLLAKGMEPALLKEELPALANEVKKQEKKEAQTLEKEITGPLIAEEALEEGPDLLGCDINYYTAGVDLKAYRSDNDIYQSIAESVRFNVLKGGLTNPEGVCLLWLLRESGCIHDIFSVEEQKLIEKKIMELTASNEAYRILWQTEFHSVFENLASSFLHGKSSLFQNPYLEGVNLLFPFLERRKAIFVDFVILGTDVASRRLAMLTFLSGKGHYVEEVKNGTETLLKIDNSYYCIFPRTIVYNKFPIQGANLVPVYR